MLLFLQGAGKQGAQDALCAIVSKAVKIALSGKDARQVCVCSASGLVSATYASCTRAEMTVVAVELTESSPKRKEGARLHRV